MKTWRITTIALLFLFVFPVIAYAGQFEAVRVYDGGTVRAVGHDIEIKIRLVGKYPGRRDSRIARQPSSILLNWFLIRLPTSRGMAPDHITGFWVLSPSTARM